MSAITRYYPLLRPDHSPSYSHAHTSPFLFLQTTLLSPYFLSSPLQTSPLSLYLLPSPPPDLGLGGTCTQEAEGLRSSQFETTFSLELESYLLEKRAKAAAPSDRRPPLFFRDAASPLLRANSDRDRSSALVAEEKRLADRLGRMRGNAERARAHLSLSLQTASASAAAAGAAELDGSG